MADPNPVRDRAEMEDPSLKIAKACSSSSSSPNSSSSSLQLRLIPRNFQKLYQRNNKRGGLKNLRCFPLCGEIHRERGFCGRPVILKMQMTQPKDEEKKEFVCWAQLYPHELPPAIDTQAVIPLTTLAALERSKTEPRNPLIKGEPVSLQELQHELPDFKDVSPLKPNERFFAFNLETKGWHYGWGSNKHSCNALHCFQVYVFEKAKGETVDTLTFKLQSALLRQEMMRISSPSLRYVTPEPLELSEIDTLVKHGGNGVKVPAKARPTRSAAEQLRIDKNVNLDQVFLKCVAIVKSTPFQVFCRRRRRFQVNPTTSETSCDVKEPLGEEEALFPEPPELKRETGTPEASLLSQNSDPETTRKRPKREKDAADLLLKLNSGT